MSFNGLKILPNANLKLKSNLPKLSSKIWLKSQEFQISNFEYREKKSPPKIADRQGGWPLADS
jgi:hypothetical protein